MLIYDSIIKKKRFDVIKETIPNKFWHWNKIISYTKLKSDYMLKNFRVILALNRKLFNIIYLLLYYS